MTRLVVEFFGPAREIAGAPEVELDLAAGATLRDVLRTLADTYPKFRETIVDPADWTLRPYFLVNLDGRETIKDPDAAPPSGSRLILMSSVTGG
jgi:molybdopterin converting factor small subunit